MARKKKREGTKVNINTNRHDLRASHPRPAKRPIQLPPIIQPVAFIPCPTNEYDEYGEYDEYYEE